MIPKIIHYCWFGKHPLPELARKCIDTWRKYCPDYELILWNEDNFDVNTVPFTAQVAKIKKWGFIVDYIRAYVIYNYGGIYLDTDVELLKPLNGLLVGNICFAGFEDMEYVNPGSIFAGEKGSLIAKDVMEFYSGYDIFTEGGKENLIPSPRIFTNILFKYGLVANNSYQELGAFTVYPSDYFSPKSLNDNMLNVTKNTYSIHHYDGSWLSKHLRRLLEEKQYIERNIKNKMVKFFLKKICVTKKIIMEIIGT